MYLAPRVYPCFVAFPTPALVRDPRNFAVHYHRKLDYGNDDGEYSQYSENPTTEGESSVTTKPPADASNGTTSEEAAATTEAAAAATAAPEDEGGIFRVDGQPSVSTYADDFVDDDESTAVAPAPTTPPLGPVSNRDYYRPSDQRTLAEESPPVQSPSPGKVEGDTVPASNQREEDIHGGNVLAGNDATMGAPVETTMSEGAILVSTAGVANVPCSDVGNDFQNNGTKACDSGRGNEASKAELDMLRSQIDAAR